MNSENSLSRGLQCCCSCCSRCCCWYYRKLIVSRLIDANEIKETTTEYACIVLRVEKKGEESFVGCMSKCVCGECMLRCRAEMQMHTLLIAYSTLHVVSENVYSVRWYRLRAKKYCARKENTVLCSM